MACPASGGPPTSGIGIALAGVHDTLVLHNKVNANASANPSIAKGGIVILSTKSSKGADPTYNTVLDNTAHGNKPSDIFWDGTGSGNKVRHNHCATSIPATLGWCHS
jgi:hypothetical protein